jgi:hypothetical protein
MNEPHLKMRGFGFFGRESDCMGLVWQRGIAKNRLMFTSQECSTGLPRQRR